MIIESAVSTDRGQVEQVDHGRFRWVAFGLAAAVALALDLVTKRLIQVTFDVGEYRHIVGGLRLQHAINDGVAFGLLSGRRSFILVAAGLAFLAILAYVFVDRRPIAAVAGGLMAGGSLGNLAERVVNGHVTDFLDVPYWPTFNVADTFIAIGVALMAFGLLLELRSGPASGSASGSVSGSSGR